MRFAALVACACVAAGSPACSPVTFHATDASVAKCEIDFPCMRPSVCVDDSTLQVCESLCCYGPCGGRAWCIELCGETAICGGCKCEPQTPTACPAGTHCLEYPGGPAACVALDGGVDGWAAPLFDGGRRGCWSEQ